MIGFMTAASKHAPLCFFQCLLDAQHLVQRAVAYSALLFANGVASGHGRVESVRFASFRSSRAQAHYACVQRL